MKKTIIIVTAGFVAFIFLSNIGIKALNPADTLVATNCKSVSGWISLIPGVSTVSSICKIGDFFDVLPAPSKTEVKQPVKEVEVFAPNLPEVPGAPDPTKGLPELVAFIYGAALWIVGIAVFVQITMGGVQWLMSAAIPAQKKEAQTRITNAIFGLILLLSSYVIMNTINPDLVNTAFNLPEMVGISPGLKPGAMDIPGINPADVP